MKNIKKWAVVKDLSPYIISGDVADERFVLSELFFSPKGESYPLLHISIHSNKSLFIPHASEGIRISVNHKNKSGEWWDVSFIPLELIGALKSLINEAVSKIKSSSHESNE